jgi:glc operon protein GlcG
VTSKSIVRIIVALIFASCAVSSSLAQMPNPYGASINIDNAKKAAAATVAEAAKNNWTVAVAVVDTGGNLVYFEKMDNTQTGSTAVAVDKARSAALFKRPTKAFQDAIAGGGQGLVVLHLQGAVPIDGGFPIVMDGKIVGAIGASGVQGAQDAQCAKAGVDALSGR